MNKIEVKSLIGQNGESLGTYVDYVDFYKMQKENERRKKLNIVNNTKITNVEIFFVEKKSII